MPPTNTFWRILAFFNTNWEGHVRKATKVLKCLLECKMASPSILTIKNGPSEKLNGSATTEYLTPTTYKSRCTKIASILILAEPTTNITLKVGPAPPDGIVVTF
jgi:hypothetical protein